MLILDLSYTTNPMAKTGSLKQTRTFNASAKTLYDLLMDSRKHSKLTGSAAKISTKVGGKYSVYDGYAEGVNLELKPNKKIVQPWRASNWPEGFYSKVTFVFSSAGKGKTKLIFTHSGIPANEVESLKEGWNTFYWEPLKNLDLD